MTRVLILGGGFGGVEVYRRLHRQLHPLNEHNLQVEMISKNNYFTFSPMLHEAATGSVSREHVAQPLREILSCCGKDFHQATVVGIDPVRKIVKTQEGRSHSYDVLVVAMGVRQGYFGTPGAQEHSVALKWLPDAIRMKNRIIHSFERASEFHDVDNVDEVAAHLSFVVVGGGATGTELAGQLSDLLKTEMARYYGDVPHSVAKITLVHAGDRLLEHLGEKSSQAALDRLKALGVDVRLAERVTNVGQDGVTLNSGGRVESRNVFWTGGTESSLSEILPKELLSERGLLSVTKHWQSAAYPTIFGLGDNAVVDDPSFACPPTAQGAVHAAKVVAENVIAYTTSAPLQTHPFAYKGDIIPIGDWFAIFERRRIRFTGKLAWWLRRTVFLQTMYSWTKRFQVAADWIIRIFLPRDTSEL